MKRIEIISITDEYEFRETLSRAKLTDDAKAAIIRDRQRYLAANSIQVNTSIPIGPYRDPLTGLIRFNTGR